MATHLAPRHGRRADRTTFHAGTFARDMALTLALALPLAALALAAGLAVGGAL